MIRRLLAVFLLPLYAVAQIPAYYSNVDFTVSGEALRAQLTTLISTTHTSQLPYTSSSITDVWNALKQADLDPNDPDKVLLIYGWNDSDSSINNDHSRSKTSSCHTSSCSGLWVREHVYPRSLGVPNLGFELAGSDAHHLRAIDSDRNGTRSNRKFENAPASEASFVTPNGHWYPGDEWRGDVARMMMYMYVRYPSQCAATTVGVGTTSYSTLGDMPDIFLEWNALDPVSEYERNRNTVLNVLQGNRNPFIDNPYLATLIWNGPMTTDAWEVLSTMTPVAREFMVYPTVTDAMVYVASGTGADYEVAVFSMLGQEVPVRLTEGRIDLGGQAKGMYFIRVQDGQDSHTFKVIVR